MNYRLWIAALAALLWTTGCSCGGGEGGPSVDGGPNDATVVDGAVSDGAVGDGAVGDDAGADASVTCAPACTGSARCRFGSCVPDLGTCTTFDDCPGDAYCSADGECLPYGVPPEMTNDTECRRPELPGDVTPVVQCEWQSASQGNVYTAPIVADLNLDKDPGRLQPSIVLTGWETMGGTRTGLLRVFDGRTCQEQLTLGQDLADRPGYGTQWAVGDLDGDVGQGGHPELVGMRTTGTSETSPLNLYAVRINSSGASPVLERMWVGRDCANGDTPVEIGDNRANFGPGIWDLNDDGSPEILIDAFVFDANGCLLNSESFTPYITHGRMNTLADVDMDGAPELVAADRIARWDTATTEWVDESWYTGGRALGHVAVADLGAYSTLSGQPVPNSLPEIIIVSAEDSGAYNPNSSGTIRAETIDGTVIWGPEPLLHVDATHGGHGGAPTASDFDGDGYAEFAAAANEYYAVYDPDCTASGQPPVQRPGGKCERSAAMAGMPDGVLWAQLSSDFSSSGTGSSVFDFNGDGAAEAVYGDECYVRVYDGPTGDVIFSAPASNGTGFELPTVVDVDGDFATEIVVARSFKTGCDDPDPLFPASGAFVSENGFVILRDPEDRWASSRPIWNQHAYSVTHVTDDARIPRTSEVTPNWTTEGLNNFRQNTQGNLGMLNLADLTVVFGNIEGLCGTQGGSTELTARVCNRGTANVQDGVRVDFVEAASEAELPGSMVCTSDTTRLLAPGDCETVQCTGDVGNVQNLFVLVDPDDKVADCHPGNNDGAGLARICLL